MVTTGADVDELWRDQLVVVETEEDHFLGYVDLLPNGVVRVRSGFRGHPHLLASSEVTSIVLAEDHPLVELDEPDADEPVVP